MIRVSLALACVLASLSACASPYRGTLIRGGACRPDIGPGGLLKIAQEGSTSFAVMKTPVEGGSTIVLAKDRNGTSKESLDSWVEYNIEFDLSSIAVSAGAWKANVKLFDFETPAVTRASSRSIVLADRNVANLDFNSPGTLEVYDWNQADSRWSVAIAHVTQASP